MRWPWVSRARYEENDRQWASLCEERRTASVLHAEMMQHNLGEMRRMYDELFVAYKELRVSGANAPAPTAPIDVPQPDVPPSVVLAAMQRISPTKDKAFEANWAYWEANKEHAAKNPDGFADEILRGVEYDRPRPEESD